MGLEGLKKKAYSAITSSISQDNVIEELVSSFSVRSVLSCYDEGFTKCSVVQL